MFVKTYVRDNLAVIIMTDNVNWVQSNRGTEICSVRLRPDKAGAILVDVLHLHQSEGRKYFIRY